MVVLVSRRFRRIADAILRLRPRVSNSAVYVLDSKYSSMSVFVPGSAHRGLAGREGHYRYYVQKEDADDYNSEPCFEVNLRVRNDAFEKKVRPGCRSPAPIRFY